MEVTRNNVVSFQEARSASPKGVAERAAARENWAICLLDAVMRGSTMFSGGEDHSVRRAIRLDKGTIAAAGLAVALLVSPVRASPDISLTEGLNQIRLQTNQALHFRAEEATALDKAFRDGDRSLVCSDLIEATRSARSAVSSEERAESLVLDLVARTPKERETEAETRGAIKALVQQDIEIQRFITAFEGEAGCNFQKT